MEWLSGFHPVIQALFGSTITWVMTAMGAALIFLFKEVNKKVFSTMLGFSAGIMIAASFWSLLAPAIELSESMGKTPWLVATAGFLSGGLFLYVFDKILPHLHPGMKESEGIKTNMQRSVLIVFAITLHNIPEGLAVGVAFGAAGAGIEGASLVGAVALAIGIAIQDFPEGAAVSFPLRREGLSAKKSFMYGQLSGLVEPLAAMVGAAAVTYVHSMLPFALSFAAGAMIFVVIEELIPESQSGKNTDLATLGAIGGFALMMILDVALG